MTTPSVIVATEHEQTVRLYVGAPSNGGMNQVGQFATQRLIDPHDLADMAMSLSIQFGWLTPESNTEVGAAPAKLASNALPPVIATDPALGSYKTPRMAQLVGCPVKGCDHKARRKNLSQHLQSGRHNWTKNDANRAARMAQPIDADAPAPPPDPKHSAQARAAAKSKGGRTKSKDGVSSLGIPANMRFGTVGRRELERVGYPKILAFIEVRGEVTSKMVATHFGESTSAAKHWLNQLEKRGDLVRVNPEAGANVEHRYKLAPQRELVTLAQPLMSSVGFGHEHEAHTNPSPIPNQESESQSV